MACGPNLVAAACFASMVFIRTQPFFVVYALSMIDFILQWQS